jgi:hypothetical protein
VRPQQSVLKLAFPQIAAAAGTQTIEIILQLLVGERLRCFQLLSSALANWKQFLCVWPGLLERGLERKIYSQDTRRFGDLVNNHIN